MFIYLVKGVQSYELFGGIALKIHTFSFSFPGQHVQEKEKVQFTVIYAQGNHVHVKEHLTCKTNFTN